MAELPVIIALLLALAPLAPAVAQQSADTTEASLLRTRDKVSRYEAVLDGPEGRTTMRGNITEVFRWDGRRWLHPSWHMDFDG